MEALGRRHVVSDPDGPGGFLGARLDYVRALCASDDRYVWLNQYTNQGNWRAHYRHGTPIARQSAAGRAVRRGWHHGDIDGLARYFEQWHRPVRIVAVDSFGSVIFGGCAGPADDPRAGHDRPPAAAGRVVR